MTADDPKAGAPFDHPALHRYGRGPDGRSTQISSRLGTPDWLAASLNYCSRCGAKLEFGLVDGEDRERMTCAVCGYIAYVNPRLVVTAIPVTDEGRVILLRRGIEPGRGLWAQPGGFLEVDETVSEAAIRETFEETGLVLEPGEIIGLYSRLEAAVVVIAFDAHVVAGSATLTSEALEIREFDPAEIPWSDVAFLTSKWAFRDWIRLHRPELLGTTPELPG
jgi:ADP-ribose pyrophosphatase YjhB (NUDIX family)